MAGGTVCRRSGAKSRIIKYGNWWLTCEASAAFPIRGTPLPDATTTCAPFGQRIRPRHGGGGGEEGEEFGQLFFAGFLAVFADFEGFGEFYFFGGVFAVPVGQFLAVALGDAAVAVGEVLAHDLGAALALLGSISGEL